MLSGATCSRNALKRSASSIASSSSVKTKVHDWRPNCKRCLATRAATHGGPQGTSRPRSFFPRQTQSQLFAMSPDSRFAPPQQVSQGARIKMQLAACAQEGAAARAISLCADLKKAEIAPDVTVYNWLLHACAKQGLANECLAFLDDMEESGIKPTIDTYNHVIYAQRWSYTFNLEEMIHRMEKDGLQFNSQTYHHIILRHVESQNLEMCLQCFADMNERNISPSLKSTQAVVDLAAQLGHARLALDLAQAFESSSVRKLETEDWTRILVASSGCLYEYGVLYAWQKVVGEYHITPDEGVCLEVLNTAARHGLTNLALHALQIINSLGVPLEEYHLVPILEAFCKKNMLEDAFSIINLMRSSGVSFSPLSAIPILDCIRHDLEAVDKAWGILEKMHTERKPIDVVSLNVIVQASALLQDLQRAVGIFKVYSVFGVKPTIETFNHILSGCVSAGHKDLGDKMLEALREQELVPDADTFERIILLSLSQSTYEDAFFYLEEMKGLGHRPPLAVYEALVRKCVVSGDPRWKIAMDELHECGYVPPPQLLRFTSSGGKVLPDRVRWEGQNTQSVVEEAEVWQDRRDHDGNFDPERQQQDHHANNS